MFFFLHCNIKDKSVLVLAYLDVYKKIQKTVSNTFCMTFKQLVDQEQNLVKWLSSLYYKAASKSIGRISFKSSELSSVYWMLPMWYKSCRWCYHCPSWFYYTLTRLCSKYLLGFFPGSILFLTIFIFSFWYPSLSFTGHLLQAT